MSKAAVVLSLLALGGSGFTAWKTGVLCTSCSSCGSGAACDRADPDDVASLAARLRVLEDRIAAGRGPAPLVASASGPFSTDTTALATAPKPLTANPTTPGAATSTADVVAALEKRITQLEDSERARPKDLDVAGFPSGTFAMPSGMPTMYTSVADAAKDLELSPSQKSDFEHVVADSKRDLEELKKIPDADGETWANVEKTLITTGEGGTMKFDLGKVMGFPSRKIPGRAETFGEAQTRITDDAKRRMRTTLTTDQAKKFEKAHVEPMLGGGGAGSMISFSTVLESEPAKK